MPKRALLPLLLVLAQLPFLGRPPHYDEPNFLALAHGAVLDPWRPHDVRINWQGTEERAFDVLSNPPGIAWWLAPVERAPVPVQRAWMLAWIPVAVFGARRLARAFVANERVEVATAILLTSPIALLSGTALLPDAPLYALTLAGVGGFVDATERRRATWGWALLAGCATLFRYSALPLPLLLGAWSLSRRQAPWPALAGFVPIGALALHDLHAYGAVHLLAMGKFQSVADTPADVAHKLVASMAMLGGAAAIPLFRWGKGAIAGAVLGGAAGAPWGFPGAGFAALGGAALGGVAGNAVAGSDDPLATRDARWLALWCFGGLLFLLTLRFSATRYWLPFLPGVLLALPLRREVVAINLVLGLGLAWDDALSARAQVQLADQVAALGTGGFTGHWGWQRAMEARGWRALDEGTRPPAGTLVAMPRQAWPQPVETNCADIVWEGEADAPYPWLPRGYSEEGRANLHASWVAGPPMTRTIAPWTFARDPYERVRVCRD